jgi:hypothetical protein
MAYLGRIPPGPDHPHHKPTVLFTVKPAADSGHSSKERPAADEGVNADEIVADILQRIVRTWMADADRVFWADPSGEQGPGFDWWPGDFKVSVRATSHRYEDGELFVRVSIRTDLLADVTVQEGRSVEVLDNLAPFVTSTYGLVYTPGEIGSRTSVWLQSTGYVSESTNEWLPEFMAHMTLLQPGKAQRQAFDIQQFVGDGRVDHSRPASLSEAPLDEMLDVARLLYAPAGQEVSRWTGDAEFSQIEESWGRSTFCFGTAGPSELTLETSFGQDSALIRLVTNVPHPELGHGLLATLQLPLFLSRGDAIRGAATFNFEEAASLTAFPQFGCWHSKDYGNDDHVPAFTMFIPNLLYRPFIATNVALWLVGRANWAKPPGLVDATMEEVFARRYARSPSR